MDCSECRAGLVPYVLDECKDFERMQIQAHLRQCVPCSREDASVREAAGLVKNGPAAAPPSPDFLSRLDQRIRRESSRLSARRFALPLLDSFAARAASIALLAAGAGILLSFHFHDLRRGTAVADTNAAGPIAAASSDGAVRELWHMARVRTFHTSTAHTPVLSDGRLFALEAAGTRLNNIVAADAATGALLWKAQGSYGYFAAAGSLLLTVGPHGESNISLRAFDAQTGEALWSYLPERSHAGGGGYYAPALSGGRLLWLHDRTLYRLNPDNGSLVWKRRFDDSGALSSPLVGNDEVFVASSRGVSVICTETGSLIQKAQFKRSISRLYRPLLAVDVRWLYAACRRVNGAGCLTCYEAESLGRRWSISCTGINHLSAKDGIVFGRGHRVRAYDGRTGSERWTFASPGCSPVTHSDDKCFFLGAGATGRLSVVDAASGEEVRGFPVPNSCAGVVIHGNRGYLSDNEGVLHALRFLS